MSKPVHIINGPNLNLLGAREPEIYGATSLDDIERTCASKLAEHDINLVFSQSNDEGELVNMVQAARLEACGLILNAGAYSHTSIAILDALKSLEIPVIEVHLSNIYAREAFRHHSYVSQAATGVICGLGAYGYILAIEALVQRVKD